MNLATIREKARTFHLAGISKLRKPELIRAIQCQEGNQPCFGADWRHRCEQFDCCWREDCLGSGAPT